MLEAEGGGEAMATVVGGESADVVKSSGYRRSEYQSLAKYNPIGNAMKRVHERRLARNRAAYVRLTDDSAQMV